MDTQRLRIWGLAILMCFGLFALNTGCPAPPPEEKPTEAKPDAGKPDDGKKEVAVEPKAEPNPEPKDEPKAEPKDEPAPEPKDEPAPEPKDEPKTEPAQEKVADAGNEVVPETAPEVAKEATPEPQPPKDETLAVVLSGRQEVPHVDTIAKGTGTVKIDAARTEIDVNITFQGITSADVNGIHIHYGKPGETGPVLFVLAATTATSPVTKKLKAADLQKAANVGINTFADAVKALLEGRCYINVHSKANASGEIRGQIGQATLKVQLRGNQEVPRVDTAALATATITINRAHDEITLDLSYLNFTGITAAHIHYGLPGENGPVFFGVSNGTFASPFKLTLKTAQLQKLAAQGINSFQEAIDALLGGFGYINLHTTKHAGGELRGQIGPAQLKVAMSGAQETPAVDTKGTGDAWVLINGDHTGITTTLNVKDVKEITAAHIHYGLPGENGPVLFGLANSSFGSPFSVKLDSSKLTKAANKGVNNFSDAVSALLGGRCYVNVHSRVNAPGEIRGQIGASVLNVVLSGHQEVPPVSTKTAGTGYVAINGNHTRITASSTLQNLVDGQSAHIHLANPGENGPVIFALKTASFTSPLTATLTDKELVKQAGAGINTFADAINALLSGHTYFNVHTKANPGGEVRGHVGRATLSVDLNGAQEVPSIDSQGSGFATVTINGEQNALSVQLSYKGATGITAAHIHAGEAGENGPVIFGLANAAFTSPLSKDLGSSDFIKASGVGIDTLPDAINALLSGHTYINIHSSGNPTGEIRGQVGYVALKVHLSGDQEVPPVAGTGKSAGWVLINGDHSNIKVMLANSGVTGFSAGHIHMAPAGLNGPVLFLIATGTLPASLDKDLGDTDLVKQPNLGINAIADALGAIIAGHTYINLHTATNPGGELRGQIGPVYMGVHLDGAQEVPANDAQGSGKGSIKVNGSHSAIQVDFTFTGVTGITAAHIHLGLPGANGPVAFGLSNASFTSPFSKRLIDTDLIKLAGLGINSFADAINALVAGHGYVNVHTSANPPGEIRGQIGQVQMRMVLSGKQEVPANNSNGFGTGYVSVDTYHRVVAVTTDVKSLGSNISAAHIHIAMPGRNGGVILPISNSTQPLNQLKAHIVKPADLIKSAKDGINTYEDAIAAMIGGRTYFNLHTTGIPSGEVRGQIGRVSMRSTMSGGQEAPAVTTTASGVGTVHLDSQHKNLVADIQHTGITASNINGAHIHGASVGKNGGVLYGLTTADIQAKKPVVVSLGGFVKSGNDDPNIDALISGLTYFNVHTTANPGGEIRGQIGAARLVGTVDGGQEVPPVTTTASGSANLALDAWQTDIQIELKYTSLNNITAAHIHIGAKGSNGAVLYTVSTATFASGLNKILVDADRNKSASGNIKSMLDGINQLLTGGTYINIHTTGQPGGEIRGQLIGQ